MVVSSISFNKVLHLLSQRWAFFDLLFSRLIGLEGKGRDLLLQNRYGKTAGSKCLGEAKYGFRSEATSLELLYAVYPRFSLIGLAGHGHQSKPLITHCRRRQQYCGDDSRFSRLLEISAWLQRHRIFPIALRVHLTRPIAKFLSDSIVIYKAGDL